MQTPVCALERRDGVDPSRRAEDAPSAEDETELERWIVCATCEHPITRPSDRVSMFGSHLHDRVNPAGVAFAIGLFARADGVALAGAPSDEFPWFPRHWWTIALCAGCLGHLGWRFTKNGDAFYGLIVDALLER
ncbi:MAG: hypothetical protein HOW73_31465 [Polyangiaceae bacterium]|nr:hypothetical protein [Polyangiaceae bacterium]